MPVFLNDYATVRHTKLLLMNNLQGLQIDYIGKAITPYQEKFAIPRQPGLATSAKGYIELFDKANAQQMVSGIEQYSHLWVIFGFHQTQAQGWKPSVRPPRLGGNKKMGVLATRSTFRPNPIGMSVVKFEGLAVVDKSLRIAISAMDLLNNTPIIDIKPYVPYSDCVSQASSTFAEKADDEITVTFCQSLLSKVEQIDGEIPEFSQLVLQVLSQDPRPAYKKHAIDDKVYGMALYQFNIQWQMKTPNHAHVTEISPYKHEN